MNPLTVALAISDEELRQEARAHLRSLGVRIVLDQACTVETLPLKRLAPDFLLVDAIPAGEPPEDLVRRVKAVLPGIKVAAVHRSLDPEVILMAMRAGTDEFIASPVGDKLCAALSRLAAQVALRDLASRSAGKVVGFVSAKGGCGATTVACHVASELQRARRHDILLADFDLESGIVAFLMQAATRYSVLDALKNVYRLDQSFWKGLVAGCRPGLDVICAPAGFAVSDVWEPAQFREVFRLVRSMYGIVIADLGRTLNPILLTLLDDLDEVFLVTTPSIVALYQAKRFIQRALDVGYPRHQMRLVLNRVSRHSDFNAVELERTLGLPVYAVLSDRPELEEAYAAGKLLTPASELGMQLAGLTSRMAGVPEEKPKIRWNTWFAAKKPLPGYQSI